MAEHLAHAAGRTIFVSYDLMTYGGGEARVRSLPKLLAGLHLLFKEEGEGAADDGGAAGSRARAAV